MRCTFEKKAPPLCMKDNNFCPNDLPKPIFKGVKAQQAKYGAFFFTIIHLVFTCFDHKYGENCTSLYVFLCEPVCKPIQHNLVPQIMRLRTATPLHLLLSRWKFSQLPVHSREFCHDFALSSLPPFSSSRISKKREAIFESSNSKPREIS